jgi:hypothetical protein
MQKASDAINALEVSLRGLVWAVLGDAWLSSNTKLREALEQRLNEEIARRDGARVTRDLLAYTHVYELRGLIEKNWVQFKPALKDRKRFDVFMDAVEDFRNVPMHSRSLLPHEESLLDGISGTIRNLTTLYRSELAPDGRHYPVVESITDSLGTEVSPKRLSHTFTALRLQVGDELHFHCRGWDPQDRPITWVLKLGTTGRDLDRKVGSDIVLSWRVTEENVGELAQIEITMSSSGKYHRSSFYDESCIIVYAVDPPLQ